MRFSATGPRLLVVLLLGAAVAAAEEAPPRGTALVRWTDLRGVVHLTGEPPEEHEVSREEWLRLKAEYGDAIKETAPDLDDHQAALTPGARAEEVLLDWWNIAGPRGAFRGHAVVSPEERAEMDRLLAVARAALKEARGTDLSPATGRAAADLRRAQGVEVIVRDPASRSLAPESLYPVVAHTGRLVRGPRETRFEVQGRISNRTVRDTPPLLVALYLTLDGRVIASREVTVRPIMARGEAPITASIDVPRTSASAEERRFDVRIVVEVPPEAPAP